MIVPRSFIGELVCDIVDDTNPESLPGLHAADVSRVLDLCTGSGCLAVLSAIAFPYANVDAVDISAGALAVAARNVADYGLSDRVTLLQSDLFGKLAGKRYDLIISNPPYVTSEAVAAFPPEYAAEPKIAHHGGDDGLDLVRRILDAAPAHLTEDGMLVVEIGMGRELLQAAYPDLPFVWLDTAESSGEVFQLAAADFQARDKGKPSAGTGKRRKS